MNLKLLTFLTLGILTLNACGAALTSDAARPENNSAAGGKIENNAANRNAPTAEPNKSDKAEIAESQTKQPRTVRDFFMLLPEQYFTLEGCFPDKDKDCRQARLDYLKTFAEIEDTKNGYLKGGCDGAQACLEMALFKRPDGTYLIGMATFAEMINDFYFLDYAGGKWTDVSASVVPEYSKKNYYELPRYGTTVKVFAKKIVEQTDDYEISEKGAKLYDLEWKGGKFTVKK